MFISRNNDKPTRSDQSSANPFACRRRGLSRLIDSSRGVQSRLLSQWESGFARARGKLWCAYLTSPHLSCEIGGRCLCQRMWRWNGGSFVKTFCTACCYSVVLLLWTSVGLFQSLITSALSVRQLFTSDYKFCVWCFDFWLGLEWFIALYRRNKWV